MASAQITLSDEGARVKVAVDFGDGAQSASPAHQLTLAALEAISEVIACDEHTPGETQ